MAACRQCGTSTSNDAYCSRRCSGLARVRTNALGVWNVRRGQEFHGLVLREVLGNGWKSGDPVTLEQAVRLIRKGHEQGYHAAYYLETRRRA